MKLCLLLALSLVALAASDEPKLWALLVAGSNGYYNYRHQSDVCHAYQILHSHGIPDERIVVMMYDDIARNSQNPVKGTIINKPGGPDVYHGVPTDYTAGDVTPTNFLKILQGDKAAMKGIGSGKVIESGPNDHVFVNFVDHGAVGIVAFPRGQLTVNQLNTALKKMSDEKKFMKLVFYMEACESGSMFSNRLPSNINVFATTASNAHESSYACYYDSSRRAYLGDVYSVKWMEDCDAEDLTVETLSHQFQVTKQETTTSHVMEYGDITIGNMHVSEFLGMKKTPASNSGKRVPVTDKCNCHDVPLDTLLRTRAATNDLAQKRRLTVQIDQMTKNRNMVDGVYQKLVHRLSDDLNEREFLMAVQATQLTQFHCHDKLVESFSKHCFDFGTHPYALKHAHVLANLCEKETEPLLVDKILKQVCKTIKPVPEGIH
jgi:legumain